MWPGLGEIQRQHLLERSQVPSGHTWSGRSAALVQGESLAQAAAAAVIWRGGHGQWPVRGKKGAPVPPGLVKVGKV